jgi:hypothetical protein
MSAPTEDDLDALPEGELLTLPDGAIPPGWLTEFFARRAAVIHQQESNELALERSGDSSLHLMIFRDMDPKEKRRRKEEEDRRWLQAEQELQEYRNRSDRLLARIEQEEFVVEKHRKEIEDNALKLHDGRRVYVDGNQYRDEQGRVLEGRDRDEAAALNNQKPNASTWQERQKTIEEADELARLKQKVLNDRQEAERGGGVSAANERLSGYEQEFQNNLKTTRTEIAAKAPAPEAKGRAGTAPITVHFPRQVRDQLKILAVQNGTTLHGLIAEAYNDLFAKYGKPEIAPVDAAS